MIPDRYAPMTYALFRIVFGFLFLCFGLQKVAGMFGGEAVPLTAWPQGYAGIIETVCGLMVMLGLFTKPAAFLASGEMAVAYWYIHVYMIGSGRMPGGLLPHLNNGVDSAMFCFAFLYIASCGAGIWSIDAMMNTGRRS